MHSDCIRSKIHTKEPRVHSRRGTWAPKIITGPFRLPDHCEDIVLPFAFHNHVPHAALTKTYHTKAMTMKYCFEYTRQFVTRTVQCRSLKLRVQVAISGPGHDILDQAPSVIN